MISIESEKKLDYQNLVVQFFYANQSIFCYTSNDRFDIDEN